MIEHKNTILAIVLSLIVVVGWNFFIAKPQIERQQREAALKQQQEQSQLVVSRADTTTLTLTPAEGIVLFTDGNGGIYVVEKLR